jgi:hypothetical protein
LRPEADQAGEHAEAQKSGLSARGIAWASLPVEEIPSESQWQKLFACERCFLSLLRRVAAYLRKTPQGQTAAEHPVGRGFSEDVFVN